MGIKCPYCDRNGTISDQMITRKAHRIKCPNCGNYFIIKSNYTIETRCFLAKNKNYTLNKLDCTEKSKITKKTVIGELYTSARHFTRKTTYIVNGILYFAFSLGKHISSAILLSIMLLFISIISLYYYHANNSFEKPKFASITETLNDGLVGSASLEKSKTSISVQEENIEDKYGATITKIIDDYDFSKELYDLFIYVIGKLPQDKRKVFLTGLEDFLSDARKWAKETNQENDISYARLVDTYNDLFFKAMRKEEMKKATLEKANIFAIVMLSMALAVFLIVLILPVLLKIEENTRNMRK